METETRQLNKLLERKKEYYLKAENEKIKSIVQIEINIIESYIAASETEKQETKNELNQYIKSLENKKNYLEEIKITLEAILLLHGINDFTAWAQHGKKWLITQIEQDRRDNALRIPNLLIPKFYGKD